MRAFNIKKRKGFGKKRECLSGQKTHEKLTALSLPWFHSQSANLNEQDIAIIGGGIASLCTAISLVKRGAKIYNFIAKMSKPLSMHLAINKALFIRN